MKYGFGESQTSQQKRQVDVEHLAECDLKSVDERVDGAVVRRGENVL